MIGLIARREVRERHATAGGWLALAAVQLLLAWMLFTQLEIYLRIQPRLTALASPLGITDLVTAPTLATAALALLLLVPLTGMGTLAGERRSGRLALLLSAPAGAPALVLGKWLGLVLCALPAILLALFMALLLGLASQPDPGRLAAAGLGLLLVAALAAAVTLWFSSLVEQPPAAAALAWGLLLLSWLSGTDTGTPTLLSLQDHLEPFLRGLVTLSGLVWFLAPTAAFLALSVHRVWRLGGGD